jgi:hypothetical protein
MGLKVHPEFCGVAEVQATTLNALVVDARVGAVGRAATRAALSQSVPL